MEIDSERKFLGRFALGGLFFSFLYFPGKGTLDLYAQVASPQEQKIWEGMALFSEKSHTFSNVRATLISEYGFLLFKTIAITDLSLMNGQGKARTDLALFYSDRLEFPFEGFGEIRLTGEALSLALQANRLTQIDDQPGTGKFVATFSEKPQEDRLPITYKGEDGYELVTSVSLALDYHFAEIYQNTPHYYSSLSFSFTKIHESFSLEDVFAVLEKLQIITALTTNTALPSLKSCAFSLALAKEGRIRGEVFEIDTPLAPVETIRYPHWAEGKDSFFKIGKAVFERDIAYPTFLKREAGNPFDYNRIFSLLFSFDHLVEQKCPDLVSGPKYQARKKCQAEIIAQIEGLISNPNATHAEKEQYRDFKRAVSKFTYSYELNIKTLFDKNESLLIFCRPPHWCDYDAFAKRAAAFRNAVAHGNPSEAEALTYSDYVLLEKIIVFLMFYDERGNEDFVTYLDGILDA